MKKRRGADDRKTEEERKRGKEGKENAEKGRLRERDEETAWVTTDEKEGEEKKMGRQ